MTISRLTTGTPIAAERKPGCPGTATVVTDILSSKGGYLADCDHCQWQGPIQDHREDAELDRDEHNTGNVTALRPAPATEPAPFITANPEPHGYAIPSPEETGQQDAPSALTDLSNTERVRIDQVTEDDTLVLELGLSGMGVRIPVREVVHQPDLVTIRYSHGSMTRWPHSPVLIARRARRAPQIVVKRLPDDQLPAMPDGVAAMNALTRVITAHPELRSAYNVSADLNGGYVQVSTYSTKKDAETLLVWFYRLDKPTVRFGDFGDPHGFLPIEVHGVLDGQPMRAWMAVHHTAETRAALTARTPSVHLLRDLAVNGLVAA